jgi:nucleoside phosphorylase
MAIADVGTLLVVAAEARELAGIRKHCRRERRLGWPLRFARTAELNGRRLVLVANGAGAALAGEACEVVWNKQKTEVIISTGYCGALDPALRAGDVFAASQVETPDGTLIIKAQVPACKRLFASGRIISVDHVVSSVEEKSRLCALGASAVEMEAVAVGLRATRWGVPFYCIRSVTDLAEEGFQLDLDAARAGDGRIRSSRILWAVARRPSAQVPEVCRLYRRSRLAARSLGDFFADCRF